MALIIHSPSMVLTDSHLQFALGNAVQEAPIDGQMYVRENGQWVAAPQAGINGAVFVSETTPTTVATEYIWIQTGLGDGSDFTVWFNDPRE